MDTKQLGNKWKVLNEKYDSYILELVDAVESVVLTSEKFAEMKHLQKELFELETELLNMFQ
jgi:hypothetical protein